MDMRELKGLEIAARSPIGFKDGAWIVPSQSGKGAYRVILNPQGDACPCEDFQLTQKPCKHVYAARLVQERDHGGKAPAMDLDAVPKRKTYPQCWPAYNLAQNTEKHRFQELLADLCRGIEEPAPSRPARAHAAPTAGLCVFGRAQGLQHVFDAPVPVRPLRRARRGLLDGGRAEYENL